MKGLHWLIALGACVLFLALCSRVSACDDLPLFAVFSGNGVVYADKIVYDPGNEALTVYTDRGRQVYSLSKVQIASIDGDIRVDGKKVFLVPGFLREDGSKLVPNPVLLPYNTKRDIYVLDEELLQAVANDHGYGSTNTTVRGYLKRHRDYGYVQ